MQQPSTCDMDEGNSGTLLGDSLAPGGAAAGDVYSRLKLLINSPHPQVDITITPINLRNGSP